MHMPIDVNSDHKPKTKSVWPRLLGCLYLACILSWCQLIYMTHGLLVPCY